MVVHRYPWTRPGRLGGSVKSSRGSRQRGAVDRRLDVERLEPRALLALTPITLNFNDLTNLEPQVGKVWIGGWINGGQAVSSGVVQVANVVASSGVGGAPPAPPAGPALGTPALTVTQNTANYGFNAQQPAPFVIQGTGFSTIATANTVAFFEDAAGTNPSPAKFSLTAATSTSITVAFGVNQGPTIGKPLYARVTSTWCLPLQADGTFATAAAPMVPFYPVSSMKQVSLATATTGNDRMLFVVSPTKPVDTSSATQWGNFPVTVLPADTTTVPPGPFGFLEFGYNAQFDTTQVDNFGLNWSFVDDSAPQVVYGMLPQYAREDISGASGAFAKFVANDPLGADFKPLLWTSTVGPPPAVIDGQFTAIVAPKDWIAIYTGSPLVGYWTDTVNKFFASGNSLSITLSGTTYTATSDGTQYAFNGGAVVPKSLLDGTVPFQDPWNQLQPDDSTVQGGLKDAVIESFSRGVALDGVWKAGRQGTMPAGFSSNVWTDYRTWYSPGANTYDGAPRKYDVYAKFLHYSTKDGTDGRNGGATLFGKNADGYFGMAYGFSLDESPSINTNPALKFPNNTWPASAAVNGGSVTLTGGGSGTITFGPWKAATSAAPVVTAIAREGASPTTAAAVDWIVRFNEAVKGVTAANFRLTHPGLVNAPHITDVTPVSGGEYSLHWRVRATTGKGQGELRLNMVDSSGVTNRKGVRVAHLPKYGQAYDVQRQGVGATIALGAASPTAAATVPFTVTFSEPVAGLSAANFELVADGVTGATIGSVTGSGRTWTVNVATGTGSGTLGLRLASGGGVAPALTELPPTVATYRLDRSVAGRPPRVSGIRPAGPSPTGAVLTRYTVTFSEPVTGLRAVNFAPVANGISGAAITNVTGSGASWTVTASTGTGSGTLGIRMANSLGVRDGEGRPVVNTPFAGTDVMVDRVRPQTRAIDRIDASPTGLPSVRFAVVFSEPVQGVAAENFAVAAAGLTGARITDVQGFGTTWTVTVLTGSGKGTLGLDLVNAKGITDAVGRSVQGLPFVGQVYTIDRASAPIVRMPNFFWAPEGRAGNLVWPAGMPALVDADSSAISATLVVTGGAGSLQAASRGGVTVAGGSGELTLTGTPQAITAFLATAGAVTYTPVAGDLRPRTLELSAGDGELAGLASGVVGVRPAAPSVAPALAAVTLLGAASSGRPLEFSYDSLVAASSATQTATRSIQFMLESLRNGVLEVWNDGLWVKVLPQRFAMPLLAPGGRLRWTPSATAAGRVSAFTMSTWDGLQKSGLSDVVADVG